MVARISIVLAIICGIARVSHADIMASLVPASAYNEDEAVMNMNLGITSDYVVERFEDNVLHPQLGVMIPGHTTFTLISGSAVAGEKWDGDGVLQNLDEFGQDGRDVTFLLDPGMTRFGIGISHLEQATRVVVNGLEVVLDVRLLPGWTSGGPDTRNGYLWIEATDGDAIESVLFDGSDQSDSIYFDHAACIPTPGGAGLACAIGLVVGMRRRRA